MAEYLLRRNLDKSARWHGSVRSAGVQALVGRPADQSTQDLMRTRGIDLRPHHARQLTVPLLRQSDLVLVMEHAHREHVFDMDPAARGKTFLLGHWMEIEIPDPYQRGEAAHVEAMRLIDSSLDLWLGKLVVNG